MAAAGYRFLNTMAWGHILYIDDLVALQTSQRGSREYVAVEKGTLLLTLDGEPHTLEAGDSIYYDGDCRHGFANPGRVPCVYYLAMDVSSDMDGTTHRLAPSVKPEETSKNSSASSLAAPIPRWRLSIKSRLQRQGARMFGSSNVRFRETWYARSPDFRPPVYPYPPQNAVHSSINTRGASSHERNEKNLSIRNALEY